jgi:hypothetical protein
VAFDETLAQRVRAHLDARGWLFVAPEATAEERELERWVNRAEAFASGLLPK